MMMNRYLKITLLVALLWAGYIQAESLTVPNIFTDGTTASASEVNDNFTAVTKAVNTNSASIQAIVDSLGSRKLYLFSTTQTFTGNAGGRVNLNNVCAALEPDSSFCSEKRYSGAIDTTGVTFSAAFAGGWLDSTSPDSNCVDWSSIGDTVISAVALDSIGVRLSGASDARCTYSFPIVCCK